MGEREFQKMLDLYIHDYMIRKNMPTTAEIFARDADVHPEPIVISPEGFLSEWWSLFWDLYSSKLSKHSKVTQGVGYVPRNVNPVLPVPVMNFMAQNIGSAMQRPGMVNLQQNAHSINVDQLASSSSSSSYPQKRVNNKRQLSVTRDDNIGIGLRRCTNTELTPQAPNVIRHDMEPADTGRDKVNKFPSECCSLTGLAYANYNTPVSDQQKQFSASSRSSQQDNKPDLAAQVSGKLIVSACESSTKMIGNSTEMVKPLDEDIESFFSNDESPDDMSTSFGRTSSKSPSGFPFEQVGSIRPTKKELTCCDFSTTGNFLVAAGHEKKAFRWNLDQFTMQHSQPHTQLITDIRFKPNSNIFATSFDNNVVMLGPGRGTEMSFLTSFRHLDHVMSLDFHPQNASLICSCDCKDGIRVWNINETSPYWFFKGANRQVRFQPQQGNVLAAATGKFINLIDVETGMNLCHFEGHAKDVRSMCWDASGQYLVSVSEDSARIWSLVSGAKCVHVLRSGVNKFFSCTFHPVYDPVVALGSYKSIYIWNPTMGNKTWDFRAHEGIVSALAHSSETKMIASVSHDRWIKLWK